MKKALKKDLEKMLESYPELKNSSLAFSGSSVSFTPQHAALRAAEPPAAGLSLCMVKEEFPASLSGQSSKIEVRRSFVHGYGVFAKETIAEGEIIEQSKLLELGWRGKYLADPVLNDYVWGNKACTCAECTNHGVKQYIALGFGSLYNHSDTPNTRQRLNFKTELITVKAGRRIEKDEELFLNYGDKYFLVRDFWKNIRQKNALEKVMQDKKLEAGKKSQEPLNPAQV